MARESAVLYIRSDTEHSYVVKTHISTNQIYNRLKYFG